MRVRRGSPYPLGATWDGRGVNVAVFSEVANAVELCLFDDPASTTESERLALPGLDRRRPARLLPRPAARAALRAPVGGPVRPGGARAATRTSCCSIPTPRRSAGTCATTTALYGYPIGAPEQDLGFDARDSAGVAPLAAVIDPAFTWGTDVRPRRALADTVIYELHVKGFTRRHPGVPGAAARHVRRARLPRRRRPPARPRRQRRRAAARAVPGERAVPRRRGPVQLLGLQHPRLLRARPAAGGGLRSARGCVREFKTMVATLHDAGIAVLLDVVYNHTAEGSQLGPDAGLPRPGQRRLLPPRRRPSVHLRRHRHRQHAQRRAPAHAAADHRQPAVLGDRDARRRLPVRPRAGARARVPGVRQAVAVLRPAAAGSRARRRCT